MFSHLFFHSSKKYSKKLATLHEDDDFNPINPPDPMMKYKVEVAYSEYGYTSRGGNYFTITFLPLMMLIPQ